MSSSTNLTKSHGVKPFVFVIAGISAISGLLFGYDIGGSGGTYVMPAFREKFNWGPKPAPDQTEAPWVLDQQGWIPGLLALGCILGSLPSGYFTSRFGRRTSIIGLSAVFSIGALIQLLTINMEMLYVGRFICGFAVGGLSMAATLYQSEMAPAQVRGLVISIQQLAITFGILLAGVLNVGLQHWEEGWRVSYGGTAVFSFILLVVMCFMPESPRWLIAKGRHAEAEAALHLMRHSHEVDMEVQAITRALEDERAIESGGLMDLFSTKECMRYRTTVGFLMQFLQQFTGINVVMYFAPIIFSSFLTDAQSINANVGVSTINFLSTFIALYAVDRAGRRLLLVTGGVGMCIFTGLFALFTTSLFDYKANIMLGYALTAFVCLYVMSFAYSWGPLGWTVPAEIFPQNLRDKGMTLTTTANWVTNLIISKIVPYMRSPKALDLSGTFGFFSSFCAFMTLFVLLYVPETKGVILEKMEDVFVDFISQPWYKRVQLSATGSQVEAYKSKDFERDVELAAAQ